MIGILCGNIHEILHWNDRSSWLWIKKMLPALTGTAVDCPTFFGSTQVIQIYYRASVMSFLGGLVRWGQKAQFIELLATCSLFSFTNHPSHSYLYTLWQLWAQASPSPTITHHHSPSSSSRFLPKQGIPKIAGLSSSHSSYQHQSTSNLNSAVLWKNIDVSMICVCVSI